MEYLAAEVRAAGHRVELAFDPCIFGGHLMWDIPSLAKHFDLRPKIIERIIREKPDVAAFSCFSGSYLWSLEIAREIKKRMPEIKTVFGGVHVSAVPDHVVAEDCIDAIAVGEADTSFPALLAEWEAGRPGRIDGVWLRDDGAIFKGAPPPPVEDLDTLPFPAKELFYDKVPALERHYMIMSARGCPYNCTYCYKSLSHYFPPGTKLIRRRSPGNVLDELEPVAARGRARMIVFRDDVFTLQKKWLEEFTCGYRERVGLPYFCYTHPNALSEESADLIKESGCVYVTIGIQSVDEKQRREVLNRRYRNDRARKTVEMLKKRGIQVSVDHIIGIPGDNEAILSRAASFYNDLRPDRLLTFWLTYYPGTEIVQIARERGCISEEDRRNIERGQGGHRYSGGGASPPDPAIPHFAVFFSSILLLPRKWIAFLIRKKLYRHWPTSFAINNLLLFINALKERDPFFFYNLRYFISSKHVP